MLLKHENVFYARNSKYMVWHGGWWKVSVRTYDKVDRLFDNFRLFTAIFALWVRANNPLQCSGAGKQLPLLINFAAAFAARADEVQSHTAKTWNNFLIGSVRAANAAMYTVCWLLSCCMFNFQLHMFHAALTEPLLYVHCVVEDRERDIARENVVTRTTKKKVSTQSFPERDRLLANGWGGRGEWRRKKNGFWDSLSTI